MDYIKSAVLQTNYQILEIYNNDDIKSRTFELYIYNTRETKQIPFLWAFKIIKGDAKTKRLSKESNFWQQS